jgi:ABC-type multidrug transport system fused ATPase/permease subunit
MLQYTGGYHFLLIQVVIIAFQYNIDYFSSRILQDWGNQDAQEQQANQLANIGTALGMTLVSSTLHGAVHIFSSEMRFRSENNFFTMMLEKITAAPVNLYFDVTPTSRILNHFNIDLQAVNSFLVDSIQSLCWQLYSVVGLVILTGQSVPHLLALMAYMCYRTAN